MHGERGDGTHPLSERTRTHREWREASRYFAPVRARLLRGGVRRRREAARSVGACDAALAGAVIAGVVAQGSRGRGVRTLP